MNLVSATCLICGGVAVLGVISERGQLALLCSVHWMDYWTGEGGLTADELRKFFADGVRGDRPRVAFRTDEAPGEYRTDGREGG